MPSSRQNLPQIVTHILQKAFFKHALGFRKQKMPAWNFVFNKVPNRHCCLIIHCQLIQLTKPNAYSASPGGFEPLTPRLGGECSIQLSYEDTLTYIKYIKLFFFFCQAYRQSTSPCSQRIPLNLRPTLGSPIKSSLAIVNSI